MRTSHEPGESKEKPPVLKTNLLIANGNHPFSTGSIPGEKEVYLNPRPELPSSPYACRRFW
jgi:hypothetical protein